ncbi:MAG: beta-propeller fold lactonase family protein [Pseudolabrys sp.]|nr:beta-propeller fold lactonase family protein [Pseudolabrys sp.]
MPHLALYRSLGSRLFHDVVDVDDARLHAASSLDLGEPIEFGWFHPSKPLLYVACGHRGAARRHLRHQLCVCRIDGVTGVVSAVGAPLRLPARPIHLSVDREGHHLFIAYSEPSGFAVHAIDQDGMVGEALPSDGPLDAGIYAHHIQAMPAGAVLLVARGNSAAARKAEEPGALKLFHLKSGAITAGASVAPNGGYGFGPRDVVFHPSQPRCYVSLERQNRLQMFRMRNDGLEPTPAYDVTTLRDPANAVRRQLAGALQIHPNGRVLYVINRADDLIDWQDTKVFRGGENSIAVFTIDPQTGEPRLVQSEDARSIYVRTFALDPGERLLIAASSREIAVQAGNEAVTRPAALTLFRIGGDGELTYVRSYDVKTRRDEVEQQWIGLVDPSVYGNG